MSNTEPLTQYFLDNRYKDEINTDNVLGHSGKVALAYAKLIKDMWSDSFTKVVPRVFKKTIGEFQPQFAGYQQQDSQELMGFLLDGLHEDLNRRLKKPAVSKIESNGRPDELIARESWRRFLLRNDSAIVDCVYGQLRSHVTCLCGKQSVTFDPFNTLSLPVPVKTSRPITVIIRLLPPESIPLKIIVEVEPNDQIKDLRTRVLARLHALGRLPHYIGKGSHANLSALAVESKPTNLHSAMIEEDEEGYIKVNHVPELPPPSSSSSSSSTVDQMYTEVHYTRYMAAKSRGEPTPPEFHVIKLNQLGTAGPTIDKTLTDKAPVGDLTRLKDEVGLFQLPFPCIVQENTYRYDYSKKTSSLEANSFVYVLDLYIGVEDRNAYNYGNSNLAKRIKIEGYPYRLLLTTKMTGRDLYSKVEEYTRRFVLPGSSFYNNRENLPFIIMTTSIYSPSYARDLVADDDTVLDISPDSNALVAVWKNEADNKANFDQVEFIKVDVLLMEDDLTVAGDDDDSSMNVVTSEPNIVSPSSSSSSSTAVAVSVSESSAKVISDESISNSARNSINDDSASGRKRKKSSGLTIYKCLDKFCEREQLNEEETLYCSQCKQHVAPVKKMDLWATPDILTVQLKRFQYIPGQYFVHRYFIHIYIY